MNNYKWIYQTPIGLDNIVMTSDGEYLTGLWFKNSRDQSKHQVNIPVKMIPIFMETSKWLDIYFSGKEPSFVPKYKINNSTPFRSRVTDIMKNIPYGKITTYNDIAKIIAKERNISKMSAQAVGNAVGANPICIIIPCHRVMGANNNLTGYGGGISNKIKLLEIEGIDVSKFTMPRNKN